MNECRMYAIYLALLSVIVLTYEWMERQWVKFMRFFTNAAATIEDKYSIYDLIKPKSDNPNFKYAVCIVDSLRIKANVHYVVQ